MSKAGNFLSFFNDDEKSELLSRAETHEYSAHDVIFSAGDEGNGLYLISNGEVAITIDSPEAKSLVINIYGSGDIIGELSVIDTFPRSANAVSLSESKLSFISKNVFHDYLSLNPGMAIKLLPILAYRIRKTSDLLWDTSFLGGAQRVARRLIESMRRKQENQNGNQGESIYLTQDEISSLSGISRESVNKILARFQELNILAKKWKRIIILDQTALERIAQLEDID